MIKPQPAPAFQEAALARAEAANKLMDEEAAARQGAAEKTDQNERDKGTNHES